jgi:hypothetical protein
MDTSHRDSDKQSLLLTQAAIARLTLRPDLIEAAMQTLDHWDTVAPKNSKPLRDEWRAILRTQDWDRAVANSSKGQQLRQSSPLSRVIDPAERLAIIRLCKSRNSNT